ncbi:MarR family winged helix-turn-helix transcriptional regulator [Streptomyces sp. NPDC088387]|uniref:MarR family winged helix-turn-helix transcriptional regulator n=1 Tax=Streptomyces sp. NPDC088387 TaxID=3365859 RepID=UPI0038240354
MTDAEEIRAGLPACPSLRADGLLPMELRAWMLMLAAVGAVEQQLRVIVKERLGVSHDEFLILCLLAETSEERLRMTRIAELLGRPKTRLTYQVACLQRAGLVTRESVCGDKRGIEVALTDKARRQLKESSEALASTVTQSLGHVIGPEQQSAVESLLPGLATAIERSRTEGASAAPTPGATSEQPATA